jgi:uncharacterized Zn-finger protein
MADEEFFLVNDREMVLTPHMYATCDGGNGPLGHPVEYLTLEKGGETMCKYCGRLYVHTSHPNAAAIRKEGQQVGTAPAAGRRDPRSEYTPAP